MNVQVIYNNTTKNLRLPETTTISELKNTIYETLNIEHQKQILYYNGKILKDTENIKPIVHLIERLNGGNIDNIDVLTVLFWIFYVISIILFIVLLFSGIPSLLAHIYRFALLWFIDFVAGIARISEYTLYKIVKWVFVFIINIFIIYFFIYAISAGIIYPFAHWYKGNFCDGIQSANWFGFICAIVYIIIYGIMNIPDEIGILIKYVGGLSDITKLIVNPIIDIINGFADKGKYMLLYVIPFLGTFFQGYFFGIDLTTTGIKQMESFTKLYDCYTDEGREQIKRMIKIWESYPILSETVSNYHLEDVMEAIKIAFNEKQFDKLKCDYENLPIWNRYNPFNGLSGKYYLATYGVGGFCMVLTLIKSYTGMMGKIGSPNEIANMIKSGSVSGFITIIAFIISFIVLLFGYI
jgi:hypothetical protein